MWPFVGVHVTVRCRSCDWLVWVMWLSGVGHVTGWCESCDFQVKVCDHCQDTATTTAGAVTHLSSVLQMYLWGTPCTTVRAFILSAHYICIICSHVLCLQQSNLNRKGETRTILVVYYTVISKEERVILCQLETGWKPCQCSPWRRPEHCMWSKYWQSFQPVSSWYRRTLYCSYNSQLRSPRFSNQWMWIKF